VNKQSDVQVTTQNYEIQQDSSTLLKVYNNSEIKSDIYRGRS